MQREYPLFEKLWDICVTKGLLQRNSPDIQNLLIGGDFTQITAFDFAAGGLGQFSDKFNTARIFVRRSMGLHIVLDLFFHLFSTDGTAGENDKCFDDLTADLIRSADHGTFKHVRHFHDDAFDFKRTDAVTGRFDHIIGTADIPEVTVFIAPCRVAGMVKSVA